MILITGAGGYIAQRMIEYLLSLGLKVLPLYRAERARIGDDHWEADLTISDHVVTMKNSGRSPKTVIHLAGHIDIAIGATNIGPMQELVPGGQDIFRIYKDNVLATANVLDFCLKSHVEHLIFSSSQTVYGMPSLIPITEDSPCAPLEHYATSKLCCENLLKVGVMQGIAVTVFRIPGVYGGTRKNGIVYKYCSDAIKKKAISVQTNMPLPIDVIHIDDVISGFAKAITHGGDGWLCLNLSTGDPCNLDLLADSVAQLIPGCMVEHGRVPQPTMQMDSTKALTKIGWKAMSRSERLKEMLNHITQVPDSTDKNQ